MCVCVCLCTCNIESSYWKQCPKIPCRNACFGLVIAEWIKSEPLEHIWYVGKYKKIYVCVYMQDHFIYLTNKRHFGVKV